PESVLGAQLMILPPLAALVFWIIAMVRERSARTASAAAAAFTMGPQAAPNPGALRAPGEAGEAPQKADDRRWMRYLGLLLVLLSVGVFALDAYGWKKTAGLSWNFPIPFWLSHAARSRYWHQVPWPFAFVPLGLVGLGLFADGRPKLARPDPAGAPI